MPKHQGSGTKAFPGTGVGRTPCQEQHVPLTSPSQPPKHEQNPWGDAACGYNQCLAHGCLSVPSRAVQHPRNPQPGSARRWAWVAERIRCRQAPTAAPRASLVGCKVPQGLLWCSVLLCKGAGELWGRALLYRSENGGAGQLGDWARSACESVAKEGPARRRLY